MNVPKIFKEALLKKISIETERKGDCFEKITTSFDQSIFAHFF